MDSYSVDDLLDLPNDEFFSSSSSSAAATDFLSAAANTHFQQSSSIPTYSTDFADIFRVPTEDAAELEWLSTYMDDSFIDFPASDLAGASVNFHSITAKGFHGRARSKRSRLTDGENPVKRDISTGSNITGGAENGEVTRRCTHCASEKTPQWRTGPLGPKTLCNACGVRFKSGRLVPEYRPAASPTFVLTQHSNSHRKVMELRRQKDQLRQQQQQQEGYGRHFRVC